jgi:hypothetical protein
VGARFERPEVMESQHMLIQKQYNTIENGYGAEADPNNANTNKLRIWAKFYGVGDGTSDFTTLTYKEKIISSRLLRRSKRRITPTKGKKLI